jgi:hypothetical protein
MKARWFTLSFSFVLLSKSTCQGKVLVIAGLFTCAAAEKLGYNIIA